MRNLDLEREISGILYCNATIDTWELENLIKEQLDLEDDEVAALVDNIIEMIDDENDALAEELSYTIANKIQDLIDAKEQKEHPEDAPWQLHLL